MRETELQKYVQRALSEPSKVWKTKSGKRLQILSPGRINPFEGPDYIDIGILLDGLVIVGDAEFHRNASEWNSHLHKEDIRYERVMLHIVCNDNVDLGTSFETLVMNEQEILKCTPIARTDDNELIKSAEDLQHFALVRLLRKATEAQKLLNFFSIEDSLQKLAGEFIANYESKRRRPVYNDAKFEDILQNLKNSKILTFLFELKAGQEVQIPDIMLCLIKSKISLEGSAFRRELVLNAVLPLALCLADEPSRINLFLWFWSTPALNKYGVLARYFPDFSQNFLWQQQGMLEYLREHGKKRNIVAEAIADYGFGEVLNFYRLGKSPFFENEE